MALKPCPRCKRLIPCGKDYCDTCKPTADAERKKHQEEASAKRKQMRRKNRKSDQYTAFYKSAAWRQTSKAKLSSCGWKCEAQIDDMCAGIATEVHHIIPIKTEEGWNLRLEWDNLEAVCVHCHNIRDRRGMWRDDVLSIRKIV